MNEEYYHADGNTFYPLKSTKEIEKLKNDKKAYLFDSLVFRYKDARYKQSVLDEKYLFEKYIDKGFPIKEAKSKALRVSQQEYERDFMRFIQVLNDAIGEHE